MVFSIREKVKKIIPLTEYTPVDAADVGIVPRKLKRKWQRKAGKGGFSGYYFSLFFIKAYGFKIFAGSRLSRVFAHVVIPTTLVPLVPV